MVTDGGVYDLMIIFFNVRIMRNDDTTFLSLIFHD
jgi:hypothetical protein